MFARSAHFRRLLLGLCLGGMSSALGAEVQSNQHLDLVQSDAPSIAAPPPPEDRLKTLAQRLAYGSSREGEVPGAAAAENPGVAERTGHRKGETGDLPTQAAEQGIPENDAFEDRRLHLRPKSAPT